MPKTLKSNPNFFERSAAEANDPRRERAQLPRTTPATTSRDGSGIRRPASTDPFAERLSSPLHGSAGERAHGPMPPNPMAA